MTSGGPVTRDELAEAIFALRRLPDPRAPAWGTVDRWARQQLRVSRASRLDGEDVHQETLIALARSLGQLEATSPAGVAWWVRCVWQSRCIDAHRHRATERRRRAHTPRRNAAGDEWSIEDLPADRASAVVEPLPWRSVSEIIDAVVARAGRRPPGSRNVPPRRLARAALLRLVLGLEAAELAAALRVKASPAAVWKWVERGRPVVLRALEQWRAEHPDNEDVDAVAAVLSELMLDRRADAGVPREGRRRAA